jgi:hypothetical protein
MAIFIPSGGIVSQINGRVGDKVYYRGRYGETVRNWVYPTKTISPLRTAVWNQFKSLMSLFNSLTPDMQDDWNHFASSLVKFNRLKQSYVPTGLQIFMERNINLLLISQIPILLPVADQSVGYLISASINTCTAALLNTTCQYTTGLNTVPIDCWAIIYATNNAPAGAIYKTNRYRIIATRTPGAPLTTTWNGEWNLAWAPSTKTPGKRIHLKFVTVNLNTGQASPPVYCSSLVS